MSEICIVFGRGLACVVERGTEDGKEFVRFHDHGPTGRSPGNWTWATNVRVLSGQEARDALQRERREAAARGVACNSPRCWCWPFLSVLDRPAPELAHAPGHE
jgi:hypothetical protein